MATWMSEGKKLDSICKLTWLHDFGDQVKITDAVSYGDIETVCIEDAGEESSFLLASPGLDQKMPILRKERTSQLTRAVQQQRVSDPAAIIVFDRDHINTSKAQANRYGTRDVLVQVECNAQRWMWLSFAAMTEGPASRLASSTYSVSRSMSASNSAL
jgi:hypothetical protein